MKQNLDDTQLQLQDSANRYFSDLNGSRPIRDTQPARWRDYLDFGWLSLSVPQAQDGSGLSPAYSAVLLESMGYYLARVVLDHARPKRERAGVCLEHAHDPTTGQATPKQLSSAGANARTALAP